jgi:hypothetical protein
MRHAPLMRARRRIPEAPVSYARSREVGGGRCLAAKSTGADGAGEDRRPTC